jgi:hypothetical protein
MRPRLPELYFVNLVLRQSASHGAGNHHLMTDRAQDIQLSQCKRDIVIGFGGKVQPADAALVRNRLGGGGAMSVFWTEAGTSVPEFLYLFGRRGHVQLRAKGLDLLGWQRSQEAFQENLGLAKTGVEIVVVGFESLPRVVGMNRLSSREVIGFGVKLTDQTLERLGQNAELLKKTGTVGE